VHDEVEQRDNEQIAISTDQIASTSTDQVTTTSTNQIASGFKNLMSLLEPNYKIPNQKTISNLIEKLHEDKVNYTKNLLESINSIALSIDGCSQAIDSYITYTGHYINKNWALCNVTLSIKEIIELHTTNHLKEDIVELLDEWNITNKVIDITHDHASNIYKHSQKYRR